ncbi:MAG TPA: hypothetical protein PK869_08205 [Candidatus Hydrogenedentes bacterium]|nr:hypothetical protein [Candidatus Hydrogenedentota bacterium]
MSKASEAFAISWDESGTIAPRQKSEGPIPVLVGVTGHIDLDLRGDNEKKLRQSVESILAEIRSYAPDSPILILSSLAEGADRLVAEIGIAKFGAKLYTVLPMRQELYEQDFPDSVGHFRELLAKGQHIIVPLAEAGSESEISEHGDARNAQYAAAGYHIVRISQVLIALWNGAEGGEGGTSDVIERTLEGDTTSQTRKASPLDVYTIPPVYRIVTPRLKSPVVTGTPFSLEVLPLKTREGAIRRDRFRRIARRLNRFNVDCLRHEETVKLEAPKACEYMLPRHELTNVPDTIARLRRIFGIADTLSIRFRKNQRIALLSLLFSSVLAVMCFELYSHNVIPKPLVFAFYPIALGVAFIVYNIARHLDIQNKYLDYRGLAEGIRVQAFWRIAGLEHEVADEYLIHHRTELDWIRDAIRAWNLTAAGEFDDNPAPAAFVSPERLDIVQKHWIEDQRKYFANREQRDERGERTHHRVVWLLFLVSVMLASAFALGNFLLHDAKWFDNAHEYIIFTIGMLPVLAASLGAYSEVMAFSAQAQRYKWMAEVYERASIQLEKGKERNDYALINTIIEDLGRLALEENGNWILLHRDHPLEVHF